MVIFQLKEHVKFFPKYFIQINNHKPSLVLLNLKFLRGFLNREA